MRLAQRLTVMLSTRLSTRLSSAAMSSAAEVRPQIEQFAALKDNYGFLLHDDATGATAAIDTPEVAPLEAVLRKRGWKLTHILNTHHHADHCGGNVELRTMYPDVEVVGPTAEREKIQGGVDVAVKGGDVFKVGDMDISTLDVGGHTLGHIAFYVPSAKAAFVGDAIFSLGCGRMFEGSYGQFWSSLETIAKLPDETALYCAHEYTAANAKFAATIEVDNLDLKRRIAEIEELRSQGKPTVPTTLALEKATNPFIRPAAVRAALGLSADLSDVDVFAKVRKRKDAF